MPSAFDRLNKVGFSAPKKLSRFDLSFSNSISQNGGEVMPILCKEVIAGDTFSITSNHVTRMITPAVPVMDNLIMDQFYFFVPMRLCSKDSKDWEAIFGTDKGLLSYNEQTAYSTGNALPAKYDNRGSIYDFSNISDAATLKYGALAALGYPILERGSNNNNSFVNLFKANAYIRIWNDWFRDENLQVEIPLANTASPNYLSGGSTPAFHFWQILNPDASAAFSPIPCLYANRLHDYFTSCLPSPQNGNAVLMPLVGNAPIITGSEHSSYTTIPLRFRQENGAISSDGNVVIAGSSLGVDNATVSSDHFIIPSNLYADLSQSRNSSTSNLR